MDFVHLFSPTSICHHQTFFGFNFSFPHPCTDTLNATLSPQVSMPVFGMSYFTMILGGLSNLTALGILVKSYSRFRRPAKAPFLQLAMTLLLTDLVGIVTTGAFALHLHLGRLQRHMAEGPVSDPSQAFCKLFGACMVFFGLCPLLLGSAMAVERCLGITQPLLHSTMVTMARVRLAVFLLSAISLGLAVLPLVDIGSYTVQFPGTWCFLSLRAHLSTAGACLALAFSSLGLMALTLSTLCNTISGMTLLQSRILRQDFGFNAARHHRRSDVQSLDVEMMTQLAVITVVSCVCWGPFLVYISLSVRWFSDGTDHDHEQLLLLCLRLASWNQILDPWVYILLRRVVLYRVCRFLRTEKVFSRSSSCTESRRQEICLQ